MIVGLLKRLLKMVMRHRLKVVVLLLAVLALSCLPQLKGMVLKYVKMVKDLAMPPKKVKKVDRNDLVHESPVIEDVLGEDVPSFEASEVWRMQNAMADSDLENNVEDVHEQADMPNAF